MHRGVVTCRSTRTIAGALSACFSADLCRTFASAVVYDQYGSPDQVLGLKEVESPLRVGDEEVLVEWLAAPINPSDINQIQGVYPIKPRQLPAVPGNEGVGTVQQVGSKVRSLRAGDRVVPSQPALGTWCESGVYPAGALHAIPSKMSLGAAATISINPATALRLLEDFVNLREGDIVVQNGANSIVGQLVIQIAARKNLRTVNVVRDRPHLSDLVHALKELGADVVTTQDALRNDFKATGLQKPKLALNCVGGSSSAGIASLLQPRGQIVTYGGLSMKPVNVPTGALIFRDVLARGFWLSGGERGEKEVTTDIDRAAKLWLSGVRWGWDFDSLENFEEALAKPKSSLLARKTVLLTQKGRDALAMETGRGVG